MMIPKGSYLATLEVECVAAATSGYRQTIAELLAQRLPDFGYRVMGIDDARDPDVTWVELANIPPFVVQVGVMEHPRVHGRMLLQLYPPLPDVRIWLRRVSTTRVVDRLADATESILRESPMCSDARWLDEREIRQLV